MIEGPAGKLELAIDEPSSRTGIAIVAHPHPLHGGTLDNKVVTTIAKALVRLGYYCVRPNFRGVEGSEGGFGEGIGETDDVLAAAEYARAQAGNLPLLLAGFSFGAYVQTRALEKLGAKKLVLVGPAVDRFQVGDVPEDTLVIHGELDEVVPLSRVYEWARNKEIAIVVVPGASHFFHGKLHMISRIVAGYAL